MFRRVKTPKDAKGPNALKLVRKTSASVYSSRMPARSARHMRHAHALVGSRQIVRIDRQPWEERVAGILNILEEHRYGRANALYTALNDAERSMREAVKKKEEMQTFTEELQAANEEMKANAEEMRAANEELRAISEELERMHTDVEHIVPAFNAELEQPLAMNVSGLEKLKQAYGETFDEKTQATVTTLIHNSKNMAGLIGALIDYWKIEAGGATLETKDLNSILEDVLQDLQTTINETAADIVCDDLPLAVVDEHQIKTLFGCLLTNAMQYRGKERPRIRISAQKIADWDGSLPEPSIEKGWVCSVSDNGIGIAENDHGDIFMLFSKASTAAETQTPGMGLAICWRIVKRHGGHIWLESTPGQGSVFYFTLPDYETQ
ncbi:MAG: ATP-binding protein [Proteobacteria bacterium]|nr:ATP-binding protein [Pseudomonadota bacterium]